MGLPQVYVPVAADVVTHSYVEGERKTPQGQSEGMLFACDRGSVKGGIESSYLLEQTVYIKRCCCVHIKILHKSTCSLGT